jgi:hypothetical protein
MHDASARRDDLKVGKGPLSPAQERAALAVAPEFDLPVQVACFSAADTSTWTE